MIKMTDDLKKLVDERLPTRYELERARDNLELLADSARNLNRAYSLEHQRGPFEWGVNLDRLHKQLSEQNGHLGGISEDTNAIRGSTNAIKSSVDNISDDTFAMRGSLDNISDNSDVMRDSLDSIDAGVLESNLHLGQIEENNRDSNLFLSSIEDNTRGLCDLTEELSDLVKQGNQINLAQVGVSLVSLAVQYNQLETLERIEDGQEVTHDLLEDIGYRLDTVNDNLESLVRMGTQQTKALRHLGLVTEKGFKIIHHDLKNISQSLSDIYLEQQASTQVLQKRFDQLSKDIRGVKSVLESSLEYKARERYAFAYKHFLIEDYGKAIIQAGKALEENSTHLPSLLLLARIRAHYGRWADAKDTFYEVTRLAQIDKDEDAYQAAVQGLVHTELMVGNWKEAIKFLEGSIKQDSKQNYLRLQKEYFRLNILNLKLEKNMKRADSFAKIRFSYIYEKDNNFFEEVLQDKELNELQSEIPILKYGPYLKLAEVIQRFENGVFHYIGEGRSSPMFNWTTNRVNTFGRYVYDVSRSLEILCDVEKGKSLRADKKVEEDVLNLQKVMNIFREIYNLYQKKEELSDFSKRIENYVPLSAINKFMWNFKNVPNFNGKINWKTLDVEVLSFDLNAYCAAIRLHHRALITSKDDDFEAAIDAYENLGDLLAAATLSEEGGFAEYAIGLYERIREYEKAANVAQEYEFSNKIIFPLFQKAAEKALAEKMPLWRTIDLFESANMHEKAADLLVPTIDFTAYSLGDRDAEDYDEKFDHFLSELEDVERATRLYKLANKFDKAADVMYRFYQKKEAIELYVKGKYYDKAAKIAEESGDLEHAVRIYSNARLFKEGAVLAERFCFVDSAITLYQKAGMGLKAAECAEKNGRLEKAIDLYLEAKQINQAVMIAKNKRDFERAVRICTDAQLFKEGAVLAEEGGLVDLAIDLYTQVGEIGKAVRIAENEGNLERAVKIYTDAKLFEKGAEFAEKNDLVDLAIELYTKAGKKLHAAKCAEKGKQPEKAIELYLNVGEIGEAVRIAEKEGNLERAVKILFEAKKYTEAEAMVERNNCVELVLSRYKESNKYEEAAIFAERNRLPHEAINCYENVKKWDEAIRIAIKEGMIDTSRQSYQKACAYYHTLGQYEESAKMAWKYGQIEDAMRDYEIMALGINSPEPGFWDTIASIRNKNTPTVGFWKKLKGIKDEGIIYHKVDTLFGILCGKGPVNPLFEQKYGNDFLIRYEKSYKDNFSDPQPWFWRAIVAARMGGYVNKASQLFNQLLSYNLISERTRGKYSPDIIENDEEYNQMIKHYSTELGPTGKKIF